MNQRLLDLYSHVSVHATADLEHEAAVELLLLVMTSDHHISEDELDEIRHISEDSGWETDTFSFDQYLGKAMAKVRNAIATGGVDALLDDIDERVPNHLLRAALFSAARDVAGVDHEIDIEEQTLLGQIAARFG
ncbi:MAG: TerB family tellurite resistance protein [Ilumatobacteraceae bacterium]